MSKLVCLSFICSSRRRHTRCALVTGVQTCALPILVDAYARHLQIQERMTNEIADTLDRVLHPRGVAVVIQASHECISSRGIGKIGRASCRERVCQYV